MVFWYPIIISRWILASLVGEFCTYIYLFSHQLSIHLLLEACFVLWSMSLFAPLLGSEENLLVTSCLLDHHVWWLWMCNGTENWLKHLSVEKFRCCRVLYALSFVLVLNLRYWDDVSFSCLPLHCWFIKLLTYWLRPKVLEQLLKGLWDSYLSLKV